MKFTYKIKDNTICIDFKDKNVIDKCYEYNFEGKELIIRDSNNNVFNLKKKNKYKSEKNEIRKLICEKKEWFYLLSRKQQLLAHLICEVPIMYPILYRIYAKILLKNKYV